MISFKGTCWEKPTTWIPSAFLMFFICWCMRVAVVLWGGWGEVCTKKFLSQFQLQKWRKHLWVCGKCTCKQYCKVSPAPNVQLTVCSQTAGKCQSMNGWRQQWLCGKCSAQEKDEGWIHVKLKTIYQIRKIIYIIYIYKRNYFRPSIMMTKA